MMRNPVVLLVFAAFLANAQSSVYRGPRDAEPAGLRGVVEELIYGEFRQK
jgi:hypothetical protein